MKNCAVLLMMAGVLSGTNALADAGELSIFHSIAIDAPADEVWAMAGDFGGIQRWAPGTESSRLILHDRNEIGAIRLLRRRGDGTQVTEKLLDYDPANRRMVYTYVDGVVRAADYYSELLVKDAGDGIIIGRPHQDRKSTRLNSSHQIISYAVFCLKKKKRKTDITKQEMPLHKLAVEIRIAKDNDNMTNENKCIPNLLN